MSSSGSGNSVIVSNSATNSITILSSNLVNSISMSNSPAKSFTVSSSYSGKPIAVDAHSYSSSIFTMGISSSTLSQKNSPKSISQPCKKFKQDDDNDVTVVTLANKTWLQADSHKLTLYDQMILINKTKLSDHHINFSQCLLHNQFPAIKGTNPFTGEASNC